MDDWTDYLTAPVPKPKPRPRNNSENPTPLQLLARQQNWKKLQAKGALATIQVLQMHYGKSAYNLFVTEQLNNARKSMEAAIYSMGVAHQLERDILRSKIKREKPLAQIPQSGNE